MYELIDKATNYLKGIVKMHPYCVIVCNTGLDNLENSMSLATDIPFSSIPGFINSKKQNVDSRLVYGILEDKYVLLVVGKPSFYEGLANEEYAFIYRVFANMGIKNAIITSSVGSLNENLKVGEDVLVTDHISLFAPNLLIGPNYDRFGPRLIDSTDIYNIRLIDLITEGFKKDNSTLKTGVYCYYTGPSYETPADIKALKILGADIVGMSMVPEATLCHQMGMNVVGIGHITNLASGINKRPLSFREINSSAKRDETNQVINIKKIVKMLPKE